MIGTRARRLSTTAVAMSFALAGCSSSQSTSVATAETPVQTALAWFSAINAKNGPAVRAHFVPNSMWTSWSDADVAANVNVHEPPLSPRLPNKCQRHRLLQLP